MTELRPFYEDVQAHYDLSDEFFALFLDPTKTYSCAYFREPSLTLEQAQLAKIDLSLAKCDLQPGQTLLDIGCGWGATARRAAEQFDVHVIGLTLSQNQLQFARDRMRQNPPLRGSVEFRLQGWEEFSQPVDRIISIGAFEHFRKQRHHEFFQRCHQLLIPGGRMMLHTIVYSSSATIRKLELTIDESDIAFARFIRKEIFPGGEICEPERIIAIANDTGFEVFHTQSLQMHYARTLDAWAANLLVAKSQAISITSADVFETYMTYLTGCARKFREQKIDVIQFCMAKAATPST